MRLKLAYGALSLVLGGAFLASCAGGALPPVSLWLLAGAVGLGGLLFGCKSALQSVDAGADVGGRVPSLDECLTDGDFERSVPPGSEPGPGWSRCCLQMQTRMCPPVSSTVACNYGLATTFNADGTCFFGFGTDGPPDGHQPDAIVDSRPDVPEVIPAICLTDATFDQSMPITPSIPGWQQCCLREQTRLCPPSSAVCNYGQATVFCPDGTCARVGDAGPCATADAADANATSP